MDLTGATARFQAAREQYKEEVEDFFMSMGGPGLLAQVKPPIDELTVARSELARDVCAAIAQRILEVETLKLQAMVPEEREAFLRFFERDPIAYFRALTKTVVREIHGLPVGQNLAGIIRSL